MSAWGSEKEIETRRRIVLSVWAYAYEVECAPIVTDAVYDEEAYKVDLSIKTNRPDLDAWFIANFDPYTGSWVLSHPELDKIEIMYNERYKRK